MFNYKCCAFSHLKRYCTYTAMLNQDNHLMPLYNLKLNI